MIDSLIKTEGRWSRGFVAAGLISKWETGEQVAVETQETGGSFSWCYLRIS